MACCVLLNQLLGRALSRFETRRERSRSGTGHRAASLAGNLR